MSRMTLMLLVAGASLLLPETTARADLAPPPPTVPRTTIEVPKPGVVVAVGLMLSSAAVFAGFVIARSKASLLKSLLIAMLIGIVGLVCSVQTYRWSVKSWDRPYRGSGGPPRVYPRPPASTPYQAP